MNLRNNQSSQHGSITSEPTDFYHFSSMDYVCDKDEIGNYMEIRFTPEMSTVTLDKQGYGKFRDDETATMLVYIPAEAKRSATVEKDMLHTRDKITHHTMKITEAAEAEIKIRIEDSCVATSLLTGAPNVMTSRYAAQWRQVMSSDGGQTYIILIRLVPRGLMDTEAFSINTSSGTARRSSQRLFASESACHPEGTLASLDIDKAFLNGFTHKEFADATGEN